MIAFATFDSETLDLLQAAIDGVWRNLPPDRRTTQIKEHMAGAPCVWRTRECAIRPDWLPRPWLPPSPGRPTRVILRQEATRRSRRLGRLNFVADRVGDQTPRRSLSGSLRRACSDQPDATDPRRSNPSTRVGQRISFYAVPQSSLNPIIVIFVARFFLKLRTRDVLFMSGFRENIH